MLYIVATPIGNLKDISLRAIETLEKVDIVACEDTRKTAILLNHLGIKKQMISYHKFSEQRVSEELIALLKQGKEIALVSDSGMPLISDPGYILVEKLKQESLQYTVIPGASASVSALVLSGLDTNRFCFVGFLPEKQSQKKKLLESVKNLEMSLIFYVSPHSLEKDIDFVSQVLGERKASLVKEITKIYETVYDFVLGQKIEINTKGEFVLVVEGKKEEKREMTPEIVFEMFEEAVIAGSSDSNAIKAIAKHFGVQKQEVYKVLKVK